MRLSSWFLIGVIVLVGAIGRGLYTEFTLLNYILIAVGVFFFMLGFILSGGRKEKKLDQNNSSKHLSEVASIQTTQKKRGWIKWVILGLFFVALFFVWPYFADDLLNYLKHYPTLWNVVSHFLTQINGHTWLGLFYGVTLGTIYFMPFPPELIFLLYLSYSKSLIFLVVISVVAGIVGESINYLIGRLFGSGFLKWLLKEDFEKWQKNVEKYGVPLIFVIEIVPLPIPLIMGGTKYSYKKLIFWTAIAKTLKYIGIIFFSAYFVNTIIPFLKSLI
jgi:membrane protein DedA with SNARE-associated domain